MPMSAGLTNWPASGPAATATFFPSPSSPFTIVERTNCALSSGL